ncbi:MULTISPECIES: SpoIIE family protein phosphatase [unclassified Streptomyces]|uniref:SpoIIE family protein phosphatase n=2 Tax=unclassified Streptomyces TaxID=2593676 RepID=UPI0011CE8D80|nr:MULTISPECIES: SpoIIE family protein phosphatase [unclassified Streptomyces]TXS60346.1 PAS domain-containing protein [Streptomyces sp. me109]
MDASDELLQMATPSALLTPDGVIRSLNAAMATQLGRPRQQCAGAGFVDLLPEDQRMSAEGLLTHGATAKSLAMRVLEFPGSGVATVVCLVEARAVTDPSTGERLVWVHSLDARRDRAGLLIPFQLAAKAADLGLCMCSPDQQVEWLGGAPALAALFPQTSMPRSKMIGRVHPDDRKDVRRGLRAAEAQSPWIRSRFLTEHDGWRVLAGQVRRVQLGYGGPERVFAVIRDDTRSEARRQKTLAEAGAERERADAITAFSSALFSAATEQELQQVVLARLAAAVGGSGALFALVDEGRLRVASDAGIPPWEVDALLGLSLDDDGPLPSVMRTGQGQFFRDHEELARRWPDADGLPLLRSAPGTALSITPLSPEGDRPLGAWVVTYDGERPSSPEKLAFLTTLADLAGQALKAIRLQQAHVELSMALQESMLPTLPHRLPGLEIAVRYQPSQDGLDVGGDWYDAFFLPDGAVALEIGDAQGHDVDAAVLMGQVRSSMRAIAAHEPDPGTVLTRTNELLVAMDSPRFASCTMLHLDPRDGLVVGTTAGHVPLLHARDDGSHTVRTLPAGPVLGIVPGTEYPEETFTLEAGTALVMVTDGVVEGPRLTLDAGLERAGALAGRALRDRLGVEETADRVLDAVAGVDHLDDVAVLVIRRT